MVKKERKTDEWKKKAHGEVATSRTTTHTWLTRLAAGWEVEQDDARRGTTLGEVKGGKPRERRRGTSGRLPLNAWGDTAGCKHRCRLGFGNNTKN